MPWLRLSRPYASAAAVGSLSSLRTSSPASRPASLVACRCASSKYAGTVTTAWRTSMPSCSSARIFRARRISADTSTGELVVPRSMPTAVAAQASLARVSPGSEIWKSAISDLRRAALDLVEVARVVAQPREQLPGVLQLGIGGALLAKGARDLVHRL